MNELSKVDSLFSGTNITAEQEILYILYKNSFTNSQADMCSIQLDLERLNI